MRYETVLGLRKEPTFDDVRQYIQADPDKIQYPKRDALFLRQSHIYAAVEQGMRGDYTQARVDKANYEASDESAPYVPPKPRPPQAPRDTPMYPPDPDTSMDDQISGPPPPPPPQQPPSNGYAQFLRGGTSTAQALAAEGIQPAQPPPALPSMLNPQPPPPPPPPAAGMVGVAYPTTAPQAFAPGVQGG